MIIILWLLIWGGMFTGIYNVDGGMFANPMALFQGLRAFFPILALYITFILMLLMRIKVPTLTNPAGLLFYYAVVGIAVSFFSPEMETAVYWGSVYLAPVLFIWFVMQGENPFDYFRKVITVNYILCAVVFVSLLPSALRHGISGPYRMMFYELPFGLGEIRANGVGRFALIILIISVVRILMKKHVRRFSWLFPVAFAVFILIQSQSRTALLGLGIAGVLLVHLLGLRWQFLFLIPALSYLLYIAGYRLRAEESLNQLVNLTGRELTWQQAIAEIKQSPFLGWGFHSDRILLDSQHIHNSYLHALMHGGIFSLVFFTAAMASVWYAVLKNRILRRIRSGELKRDVIFIESILITGFLTARSFFESTAAFYGVDLLLFVPAAGYIYLYCQKHAEETQTVKNSQNAKRETQNA
jgi:O-antigen ligase